MSSATPKGLEDRGKRVMGDQKNSFISEEKPVTTSSKVNNILQEVSVSLLKSTIKMHLHECKYRGFITRCKLLVTLKKRKVRMENI